MKKYVRVVLLFVSTYLFSMQQPPTFDTANNNAQDRAQQENNDTLHDSQKYALKLKRALTKKDKKRMCLFCCCYPCIKCIEHLSEQ